MNAFLFFRIKGFFCFLIFPLFFLSCHTSSNRNIQPAFYYWKTNFQPTQRERNAVKELSVQKLYVKLFDVSWNENKREAQPTATIRFSSKDFLNNQITPVVFITNQTLVETPDEKIEALASHLLKYLTNICSDHQVQPSNEVQIDCDWTAGTKGKYFRLLKLVHQHPFLKGKLLSCTIRLHQLKFISLNGIPPADKGLLMCYNMGNLKDPKTHNSIVDVDELKKYTGNLQHYPLPLDVALPIFDWYVLFEGNIYKGLIHELDLKPDSQNRITFNSDTSINGINFTKNHWLRYENSPVTELVDVANHIQGRIGNQNLTIIFYHLSEKNIDKYKHHELETICNSFR